MPNRFTQVTVIIATSHNRTDWLINRCLRSVYLQERIDQRKVNLVVVDDNKEEDEFSKIRDGINVLRSSMKLGEEEFATCLISNSKTKGHSGTGAWNTGIEWVSQNCPGGHISILDDDDEYLPSHLFDCISALRNDESTAAVFQQMQWKSDDGDIITEPIVRARMTAENFFIGNPGVQGSNMFFKTSVLNDILGFDEQLPNTTDRDLMIRFLWYMEKYPKLTFEILEKPGVIHYNHSGYKVNNDLTLKHIGLNLFYAKYAKYFSIFAYEKSIARAKNYFNYHPAYSHEDEVIVIGMPLKNNSATVRIAISSFLSQRFVKRKCVLLIINDSSNDGSDIIVSEYMDDDRIRMVNANLGSVSRVRNFIHHYVQEHIPTCCLIGRLDADDYLPSNTILSEIEAIWDREKFDVLFMGNKQSRQGEILEWVNKADQRLLDYQYLANRLLEMADGNPKAELPSCNTFIRPYVTSINYPDKASAEDHWYSVMLIMSKETLKIEIAEDKVYCVYSLDGATTASNKDSSMFRESRIDLHNFFVTNISHAR